MFKRVEMSTVKTFLDLSNTHFSFSHVQVFDIFVCVLMNIKFCEVHK